MTLFFFGMLMGLICGIVLRSTILSPNPSHPDSINIEDIKTADPELANIIQSQPAVPVESIPDEITRATQTEIQNAPTAEAAIAVASKFIRDLDVAKVVVDVTRWDPRRCRSEIQYQNSFLRHVRKSGYRDQEIQEKLRISWGGDHGGNRTAIPDLILRNRVLVELKADLTASGETDRAMGQMLRYLLAWKGKGPSILLICGDVSPELRFLIRLYISTWRKTVRLPVTVLFRKFPTDMGDEMPTEDPLTEPTS